MSHVDHYESAMMRALEVSLRGPANGVNPQVGAVILDPAGQIVSEGWHLGSGSDHAEIMALKNFAAEHPGVGLFDHTAVVTLEPCNHTGKTGPCAEALITAGIGRVVFASKDPGGESSNGEQTLEEAGIEVISGVLNHKAEDQNRVWLLANRLHRPFVTLKWASSLDGRTAANDGTSQWISGVEARADTHKRRSEADSILVGTGTAMVDDPELTARKPDGSYYESQPTRIVIGQSPLPKTLKLFNDKAPTIELKTRDLGQALAEIWAREIKHVFVEGGPAVANAFVRAGLVDEFIIYLAPMLLGGKNTSLQDIGIESMSEAMELEILETQSIGKDIFIRARRA
ncbi:MAG: bifunctional diaminohydroxyphosphoribosylaminopyrimidine deaminase/5-amino-6-(5-phosphoribosylamino)uracil reductase RibD [Aquiluna sp.]|nr:bifunctional diaminohydroxyphosphoribosylaminopyrimidine deaminase/5-amino-6-(5-phosphoribosylamino)uracil reductase RibD [Aquiluna sp.]